MPKTKLTAAAYDHKLVEVRARIAAGDRVDGTDGEIYRGDASGCLDGAPYYTPLGEACRNTEGDEARQLAVVEVLLDAGAPVNQRNYRNETALHFAAYAGRARLIDRLHAAGADLSLVGCLGGPIEACLTSDAPGRARAAALRRLLVLGVDPRAGDDDGASLIARCAEASSSLRSKSKQGRERGEVMIELCEIVAADARVRSWTAWHSMLDDLRRARARGDAKANAADKALDAIVALAHEDAGSFVKAAKRAIGKKAASRAQELRRVATRLLAAPGVVRHAAWPDLVRALLALTVRYEDFTKEMYGTPVAVADIEDDDGGAFEAYSDEGLSTIELCLSLCATPEAIARPELVVLVEEIAAVKWAAVGAMSFGDQEAVTLVDVLGAAKHPAAGALRALAERTWPYGAWRRPG